MKFLISILLAGVLLCPKYSHSELPKYLLDVNDMTPPEIICNILEFDIELTWTNPGEVPEFQLAGGQYFFNANIPAISNGGNLTYQIVNSELPLNMQPRNPQIFENQLRLAVNQFPGSGNGFRLPPNSPVKVVRMRLSTSQVSFANVPLNLEWRSTFPLPFTKIFAYIGNVNTEVTVPASHILSISNEPLALNCEGQLLLLTPEDNSVLLHRNIRFSWSAVSIADSYNLSASNDSNFAGTLLIDTTLRDTSVDLQVDSFDRNVFWRVTAIDSNGLLFSTSEKFKFLIKAKPELVSPPNGYDTTEFQLKFVWRRSFADLYMLEVSRDTAFTDIVLRDSIYSDTSLIVSIPELTGQFYWRVASLDSSGIVVGISGRWGFIINQTPQLVQLTYPPDNSTLDSGYVNFNWMPYPGSVSYRLKVVDTVHNYVIFDDSLITGTSTSVNFVNVRNGSFEWSVSAKNSFGDVIAISDQWSFAFRECYIDGPQYADPNQIILFTACADGGEWTLVNLNGAHANIISGINDDSLWVFTGPSNGALYLSYRYLGRYFDTYVSMNPPLEVELASFTSESNGNNVSLKWITSYESDNYGFEVQRSDDGKEWRILGFVRGVGNSSTTVEYAYQDRGLTAGSFKYRLKQIDNNGGYKYHNLKQSVEIGIPDEFVLGQNYPNPFNPATTIVFELPVAVNVGLKIFDISGREVKTIVNEFKQAGYYSVTFRADDLASGIYFYRIAAGEFVAVRRMILIK